MPKFFIVDVFIIQYITMHYHLKAEANDHCLQILIVVQTALAA